MVILLGPTASGKTDLALELAEQFKLDILNIDSRQLYRGMDIGTAKPSQNQLEKVVHFLINLRDPNHPMNQIVD